MQLKGFLQTVFDKSAGSPLMTAARDGDMEAVKELLVQHPNLEERNVYGLTALHLAALNGNLDVVRLLLDKGSDINAMDKKGYTPLMRAASYWSDVVRLLVDKKADIALKNERGETAQSIAKESGHKEIEQFLKDNFQQQRGSLLKRLLHRENKAHKNFN